MMLLAVILAGVAFYEVFVRLQTMRQAQRIVATAAEAQRVVQSTILQDEEKAVQMQRGAAIMFSSAAVIAAKMALASLAAVAVLWLASLKVAPFAKLVSYSFSPLVLGATVVALSLYGWLRHGR